MFGLLLSLTFDSKLFSFPKSVHVMSLEFVDVINSLAESFNLCIDPRQKNIMQTKNIEVVSWRKNSFIFKCIKHTIEWSTSEDISPQVIHALVGCEHFYR